MTDARGQVIAGRYRLDALLSRGGMGEVWRGHDTRLGRPVAVKLLTTGLSESTDSKRFFREARLAARLSHHNVVAVYDVGEWEARPYLVMELLDGDTLAELLDTRGPLPGAEICRIGAQVAEGLAAAHAIGVIHRDVKPGNVMRTSDGSVKVLDFGIARLADDASTRLTRTGLVIGTAAYIAPEQLTGGTIDERSDLYALGCVLYELATGRPPFDGGLAAIAYAHVHSEAPPASETGAPVTPELDSLLSALLAKDPAARPQSAAELAVHLRRLVPLEQAAARAGGVPTGGGAATRMQPGRAGTQPLDARRPSGGTDGGAQGEEGWRSTLIPVLVGVVVVLAIALAAGLVWLGSLGGQEKQASARQSVSPSSPPTSQAPEPPATPGPDNGPDDTDPDEDSSDLEYGSEDWLRALGSDIDALVDSGRLDDRTAEKLRKKLRDALEARAEGRIDKMEKRLAEIGRRLGKEERENGELPDGGLLGSILDLDR